MDVYESKDRKGKHKQRRQQTATKTKSRLVRNETKKRHVQTEGCKAAEAIKLKVAKSPSLVVRLHKSKQPVLAKTVENKTKEFHTGPRPSR